MISRASYLKLPDRIRRLDELAHNMWWSWHPQARGLFVALDYRLWKISGHNPVKQLRDIGVDKLQAAASDPAFVSQYNSVITSFDADMSASNTWFTVNYPDLLKGPIAYFSMEFAIHNSLPIYAGGLGILAGDTCKEASDLGIPLVGIGFMYPQGYFQQSISADGYQEEVYRQLNFNEVPITPVFSADGKKALTQVELNNTIISIGAWRVQVGRVNLYLLDTNIEENDPGDRQLSARLYIADPEIRIQQEIVLGIGGVRVLRALNIHPAIWHANEGHTAFMMLERMREEIEKGVTFDEAFQKIQATTVFTTHTPVPAGHDMFSPQLMVKYFHNYWKSMKVDEGTFIGLGQQNGSASQVFNMTALALRAAGYRNAVSHLHGIVTRKMWSMLWPERAEEEVPIYHITNGIHVPTWVAPEMSYLFGKYLSNNWVKEHDDTDLWKRVYNIPDEELWEVRKLLKRKLMAAIRERAQRQWAEGGVTAKQILVIGALLDPEVLTIGFVRRFTSYKRPGLIFQDVEHLKRIVRNQWRPIQLIFAGKSHPADFAGKQLLHQIFSLAANRDFQGRVAFIEDYDMHMAHYLVHGVDVWLNNPRRLEEACGTSGMKASLNGVPNLSIQDGWWHEGYNGTNGWAIGSGPEINITDDQDKMDAESIYRIIEEEIVPLYYERDHAGVPHGWMHIVKEAISSVVPHYCARRMMKEYAKRMYLAAAKPINK